MNERPSRRWHLVGATMILIPCAVLAGFFASQVAGLLYFPLLYPVGLGLIGAVLLAGTLTRLGMRGGSVVAFLGTVTALTMYTAVHCTDYWLFRLVRSSQVPEELIAPTGSAAPALASVSVDYALKQETATAGFLGFMRSEAHSGIPLGRWYGGVRMHLGPMFTWVYWSLECALITWLTVRGAAVFSR